MTTAPAPVSILGTGSVLPRREVTSLSLDQRFGREPGTSERRSGVRVRYWADGADPAETSSGLATAALVRALDAAALTVDDLDAVIVSAVAPQQPMPTTAVLVLAQLGATGGRCEAFDLNASCVGFLTGLDLATTGITAGRWRRVAVVASELATPALNHEDPESSALFGDGAAAAVLGPPVGDSAVLARHSAVWPEAWQACRIESGGTRFNTMRPSPDPGDQFFRMDGPALLRAVARAMPSFVRELDRRLGGVRPDVVIPHQASAVGLRYLRERSGISADRVVDILADHGNQVSASIPTALDHAVRSGQLRRGDTALLLGTGAGLSLSAAVVRY